jgi:exopolysaccharide biosynthesis polyprenyl glycosylphosphotransferase
MNADIGRPRAADGQGSQPRAGTRQQPSRRTLRIRLHLSLIAIDLACIAMCFWLAEQFYPVQSRQWITMSSAILPFYLIAAFYERAYSVQVIQNVAMGVGKVLRSYLIAAAAVLFIAFYLKSSEQMSRGLFALGSAGSLVALGLARMWFARGARWLLGGNPYTVVLITSGGLDPSISSDEFSVVIPTSAFDPASEDPAMYDRLAKALKHADRVVVHCGPEQRNDWVHALQGANVVAEIMAPELTEMGPMTIARAAGVPTLVVARGPLSFANRIIKRGFDFSVALAALIFISPLLLVVAVAIRLESPGSVLFVQTRIGRANRQFRMFKFRSMRNDLCDANANTLTARDDARVTRVGKFIRATSIDELPQLFNVLRGEMSIVGPRPHALGARADEKLYWEVDQRYWHRHAAKPGLTGLAQVRGFRGATDRHIDLVNRLHADLEYLDDWTIWRDLKIILMTFRVLMHKNAF